MKGWISLVGFAAGVVLAACTAVKAADVVKPRPTTPALNATLVAAGTDLKVVTNWTPTAGTPGATDSILSTAGTNSLSPNITATPHEKLMSARADTLTLLGARPAAGATVSGFGCIQAVRVWSGGRLTGAQNCKSWSYTEPVVAPPPPTTPSVDSLKVFPASLTLTTITSTCQSKITANAAWSDYTHGIPVKECRDTIVVNSTKKLADMLVQFCSIAHWTDGVWSLATPSDGSARCQFVFDSLPLPNKSTTRVARVRPPSIPVRTRALVTAMR